MYIFVTETLLPPQTMLAHTSVSYGGGWGEADISPSLSPPLDFGPPRFMRLYMCT